MTDEHGTNTVEHRRWNDEFWVKVWPKRERLTDSVTPTLLDRLGLARGERVLDIGSGGGNASLAAAALVEPGPVIGADISAPLVELAASRALERHVGNAKFVVADVQQADVDGGPFDVAMSQFGVMFFDEPVTAFGRIRRQVVSGGRLGFACWQSLGQNPWFVGPALAGFVPPPSEPAPGKSPTGPYTLSDPARVTDILTASGWSDINRTAHEQVVTVDRDAIVDDAQLRFLGVPEERLDRARAAVDAQLSPLSPTEGRVAAPLAFQIFTATA
jgi:SAM-dependent methyltransferase